MTANTDKDMQYNEPFAGKSRSEASKMNTKYSKILVFNKVVLLL